MVEQITRPRIHPCERPQSRKEIPMKKLTAFAAALLMGSAALMAAVDAPAKGEKAKAECKDKACCKEGCKDKKADAKADKKQ